VSADPDTATLAPECLRRLIGRGDTVATAESLTAGLVSATLADVPGASSALRGGVATYATQAKISVLGVPQTVIEQYGVISEQCATSMARSVRSLFDATWGISTTGVAGPDRQEHREVGTVYVAVAGLEIAEVRALHLSGGRADIRLGTVGEALSLLLEVLRAASPE
jgi:nicotinamide-nucleotide amidase